MKLIYEITLRDDKTYKYECADFAAFNGDFITLFKKNLEREHIRTDMVINVRSYIKQ